MDIISSITEYLKFLIGINLYGGAFLAALIETVFPPIPSEIVMPLAGYLASLGDYGYLGLLIVSISATIGATLGAVIIYYASMKLGRLFIIKYGKYFLITEESLSSAEKWFDRYGSKAVFFGRMAPGVRELVSIPAGISKMRFGKFLFYTLLGSFIWTIILVSLGYFLGVYVESMNLSGIFSKFGVFLLAIIVIYFVIKLVAKKFESKNKL